ncbi:MAG: VanW family protein [Clostridia bacterium]|nr:VanW family protein [Clostridia bacterium]
MNPYERVPQTTSRRRRTERYAGTYEAEPSMNAPQPMPAASGSSAKALARMQPAQAQPSVPVQKVQAATQAMPGSQAKPVSQGIPVGQSIQVNQPASQARPVSQAIPVSQAMPVNQVKPVSQAMPAQPLYQTTAGQQSYQNYGQQGYYASQPQAQQQAGWQQPYYRAQPQQNWQERQPYENYGYAAGYDQQVYQQPSGYAQQKPSPTQPPEQGTSWKSSGGEPPRKKGGWLKLVLAAAAIIAAVVLLVSVGSSALEQNRLYEEVSAYDSLFCQGVYVDGIHLGGMTQEEAIQAVMANAQQRRDAWRVELRYQGELARSITASDLSMTVNVTDALAAAWEQGHASSDVKERKAAMDALIAEPYYGSTALPSGNTSAIDTILQQLADVIYYAPTDAYIADFDPTLSYPFKIVEAVPGRMLDIEPIREQLYDMVANMQSGTLEITPTAVQANVTSDDLKKTAALRGSAYTLISTMSEPDRTKNIIRACQLISGKVIKPGDTFSFNTVVGSRTAENGFFKAIEYAYGEERYGYGGGVCQVSTTIYLAAVRANMEIVKREQHSDKVNYTEYGLDATVNYDGKKIDFVFRNNTQSNIYIVAKVETDPKIDRSHKIVLINIYGESLGDGVSYDLIAETVETLLPPEDPVYVKDKDGANVVYIDEEKEKSPAKEGYVVDSFKVKYVNGTEVERTYMYTDTYKAKAQQIWVGVSEREDDWLIN